MSEHWPTIWEKLQAFKGDLVPTIDSEEVHAIVGLIDGMRGISLPVAFLSKWKELRSLITKLLGYPNDVVLSSSGRLGSPLKRRKSTSSLCDKHPQAYL